MYCVNTYSNVALFRLPKKENEDAAKWKEEKFHWSLNFANSLK